MAKKTTKPAYWEPDNPWQMKHKKSIAAIKAIYLGNASSNQQKLALMFIIEELCGRHGNQFYPSERDTTFALGKKFVADNIAGIINNAKLGTIEEVTNATRTSN